MTGRCASASKRLSVTNACPNFAFRIILETESSLVTNRVAMKGADKDVPLSEQSFSQALQTATQQIVKTFR